MKGTLEPGVVCGWSKHFMQLVKGRHSPTSPPPWSQVLLGLGVLLIGSGVKRAEHSGRLMFVLCSLAGQRAACRDFLLFFLERGGRELNLQRGRSVGETGVCLSLHIYI